MKKLKGYVMLEMILFMMPLMAICITVTQLGKYLMEYVYDVQSMQVMEIIKNRILVNYCNNCSNAISCSCTSLNNAEACTVHWIKTLTRLQILMEKSYFHMAKDLEVEFIYSNSTIRHLRENHKKIHDILNVAGTFHNTPSIHFSGKMDKDLLADALQKDSSIIFIIWSKKKKLYLLGTYSDLQKTLLALGKN